MLCPRCQKHNVEGITRGIPPRKADLLSSPLRGVMCARCGSLLPVSDPTATMLEKLTQLARFGLTAEGQPLFERKAKA